MGTKIVLGVTPESIVKLPSGKLEVTYSDGNKDEYDTVLAAVGRYADVATLGLEALGARVNPKTGKLVCDNEQTSIPHIYAIGMVYLFYSQTVVNQTVKCCLLRRRCS